MIHKIKGTNNHFIHSDGFVFHTTGGKEVKVKASPKKTANNELYVRILKKYYRLSYLMFQYFFPEIKDYQKLSFGVTCDNRIPKGSISIKNGRVGEITDADRVVMLNYKCAIKAGGANRREKNQVLPREVFETLRVHDFKCIYCNTWLKENDWHLDHYYPISKGGKNVFENLVPSCSVCNIMKGALLGEQFYKQCCKIAEHFSFKPKTETK